MQTRKLGNSDLMITPVGFGAWAIGGGDWAFAWGAQEETDSIAAIHRALELGVNWIERAMNRSHRLIVILRTPGELPVAAADGPGAKADRCKLKV